jgi:hypothetical protein
MKDTLRVICISFVVAFGSLGLAARQVTTSPLLLPESAQLSDVEIRWQSGGGDGCAGECTNYRITIRGDGRLTLEDLGWGMKPPKASPRQRSVPTNVPVSLVNELLKARFLEAPSAFAGSRVAVQKGGSLFFYSSGAAGAPWVDLTLRIGPNSKTVRLAEQTPQELRSLERRIWEIGGPKAWPPR